MKQELNETLRLHKLWLAGKDGGAKANLEGANLKGANLYEADLEGANLKGADLEGADLCEAYLEGANLEGANLEGANLKGANLKWADLEDANLKGANLEGANLERVNLKSANLCMAYLRGADIDYASWPLWCDSLSVTIDACIAAQLAYHCVRACQSVTDDPDVVAFCSNPVVIKLANRFHRVKECGRIEAAKGGAK